MTSASSNKILLQFKENHLAQLLFVTICSSLILWQISPGECHLRDRMKLFDKNKDVAHPSKDSEDKEDRRFDTDYLCLLKPEVRDCFRYKLMDDDNRGFREFGCCLTVIDQCKPLVSCYFSDMCHFKQCNSTFVERPQFRSWHGTNKYPRPKYSYDYDYRHDDEK